MAKKEEDLEQEQAKQRESDAQIIDKLKNESEDYFEKNVTYISAGTLVLSLTFVEKIVNLKQSSAVNYLIASWVLMALTLGVNLASHLLSSHFYSLTTRAIRKNEMDGLEDKIDQRNLITGSINALTAFLLVAGMITLIIFCSINAINMSKQPTPTNKAVLNNSNTEQKGKTIPVTSSVILQGKPAGTTPPPSSTQSSNNTTKK